MERYVEALRGDPENAEALYYVAVVACQQGDLQTGIDLARRSLSFDPRQPRAHNVLGQALQRQKQFDEALACYDKALEYDANFVDALANRANLLGETGRHAHAIAAYDKVLALRPGLPQDWCNRGQSQHALGQLADAIASYDRALALDPKFALAHTTAPKRSRTLAGWRRLSPAMRVRRSCSPRSPTSTAAMHWRFETSVNPTPRSPPSTAPSRGVPTSPRRTPIAAAYLPHSTDLTTRSRPMTEPRR